MFWTYKESSGMTILMQNGSSPCQGWTNLKKFLLYSRVLDIYIFKSYELITLMSKLVLYFMYSNLIEWRKWITRRGGIGG